jgi:hypothetical protein
MSLESACHQFSFRPLASARRAHRRVTVGAALVALLMLATAPADAINRCEGRDGRVTYTDEPCPTTARNTRRVDDSPPVQVREAAAREARADAKAETKAETKSEPKPDTKADAGKDGAVKDAKDARDAGSGRLQPGRIVASTNPEQEMQRLDEQRARQQRQCADLNRRIDYARRDLQGSIGGDRASAELALRRLQEEAKLACPAR